MKCGWSDRPKGASGTKPLTRVEPREDVSPLEIKKILAEATEQAMFNMKPRRLQQTEDENSAPKLSPEDLLRRDRSTDS